MLSSLLCLLILLHLSYELCAFCMLHFLFLSLSRVEMVRSWRVWYKWIITDWIKRPRNLETVAKPRVYYKQCVRWCKMLMIGGIWCNSFDWCWKFWCVDWSIDRVCAVCSQTLQFIAEISFACSQITLEQRQFAWASLISLTAYTARRANHA